MQWLVGALVLILCFMKRGEFSGQIVSNLGSSFSMTAFVVVLVSFFNKELLEYLLFTYISLEMLTVSQ